MKNSYLQATLMTILFFFCTQLSFAQDYQRLGADLDGGNSFEGEIKHTSISGDGDIVAVTYVTNMIQLFKINGLEWETYGTVLQGSIAFLSSDANRICIGDNNTSKVYSWNANNSTWSQLGADIPSLPTAFAIEGNHILTAGDSKQVYEWTNNAWVPKGNPFQTGTTYAKVYDISADGNTLLLEYDEPGFYSTEISVYEWNNNSWQLKGQPIVLGAGIRSGALTRNGTRIALSYQYPGYDFYEAIIYEWIFNSWQDFHYLNSGGPETTFSSDGNTVAFTHPSICFGAYNENPRGRSIIYQDKGQGFQSVDAIRGDFNYNRWSNISLSSNGQRIIGSAKANTDYPAYGRVFQQIPELPEPNEINLTTFENDWGIWQDGGAHCERVNTGSPQAIGDYCINLNSTGDQSHMVTNNMDLSQHEAIIIDFSFYMDTPISYDEFMFFLEISYDGGNSFNIMDSWPSGTSTYTFQCPEYNNFTLINESSYVKRPFTPTTQFRFRCDIADLNNSIFIDNISIRETNIMATCSDNIMNGDETEVDCGGSSCDGCDELFVRKYYYQGHNTGKSWAHAFNNLQDALAVGAGKTIHISSGTYKPTDGTERDIYFDLPDNVQLMGGYSISYSGTVNRDPDLYKTILSGDLDNDDTPNNNSYHTISINNSDDVLIDGITITSGNADTPSSFARSRGGGIYAVGSTFSMNDVIVEGNNAIYGGGIFFKTSEVQIEDCEFENNTAQDGSAIYSNNASTAYISRSKIQHNTASNRAAIEINNSTYTSIDNSLINENTSANENALALIGTNKNQICDVFNCTILGDSLDQDLLLLETDGSNSLEANLYNTIMTHQDSDDQGLFNILDGGLMILNTENCYLQNVPTMGNNSNNIYANSAGSPMFDTEFGLLGCSSNSGVNAGSNSYAASFPYDLYGNERIINNVDIGAVENSSGCLLYVDQSAQGNNTGDSWADAFTDLQDALAIGEKHTILIADGTYYPTAGSSRGISFEIPEGAKLIGQYPPGGGNSSSNYETILSGNVDNIATYAGNSYHVVKLTDVDDVILENLVIRDGNANDPSSFGRSRGGGLYLKNARLTLKNVEVKWNKAIYGGGLFARLSQNITIEYSEFKKNTADFGAALYHSNETQMYIDHSIIHYNTSNNRCAVEVNNSLYTEISNSVIGNNNSANANAIGLIATNRNQTFYIYNSTILGGGANKNLLSIQVGYGDVLDVNISNTILAHEDLSFNKNIIAFNNGTLNLNTSYCYIQGSSVIGNSSNNLYSDSAGDLLLDVNNDYVISPCSPIVNAGNDNLSTSQTDIFGNNRFYGTVDIGAYESNGNCMPREVEKREAASFVKVYPNPTNNFLHIQSDMENYNIRIYNILGNEILTLENPTMVNLKELAHGIYILNVLEGESIIQVEKIVKK